MMDTLAKNSTPNKIMFHLTPKKIGFSLFISMVTSGVTVFSNMDFTELVYILATFIAISMCFSPLRKGMFRKKRDFSWAHIIYTTILYAAVAIFFTQTDIASYLPALH